MRSSNMAGTRFGFLDIPDGIAITREKKEVLRKRRLSSFGEKQPLDTDIVDIKDNITCEALRTALRGGSAGLYFNEAELAKVVGNI